MHIERKEFDLKRFLRYRDYIIEDPYSVAVAIGDFTEGRTPGMKHFDPSTMRKHFLADLDKFYQHSLIAATELLMPLVAANVPLVIVEGNHDRYAEWMGYASMLAKELSAEYIGGGGFIRVRSGAMRKPNPKGTPKQKKVSHPASYSTVIYATHGHGGGRTPGPKVNDMQRTLEWCDADVILKGHVHDADARVITKMGVTRRGKLQMVETPVTLYRVPSFVRHSLPGLTGYQVRQGYPTGDNGLIYLAINPKIGRVVRKECEF